MQAGQVPGRTRHAFPDSPVFCELIVQLRPSGNLSLTPVGATCSQAGVHWVTVLVAQGRLLAVTFLAFLF